MSAIDKAKEKLDKAPKKENILGSNSIELKGKVYELTPLLADDGLETWSYILKIILPSLGSHFDSIKEEAEFGVSEGALQKAIAQLTTSLQTGDLTLLSTVLFKDAKVDGELFEFREEFSQNYYSWMKLFKFGLEVNFRSFFEEGLGELVKEMRGLMSPVESEQEVS